MISDDLLPQDKLFVNITTVFEQYSGEKFEFIHGTATHVDHTNRTVAVSLKDNNSKSISFHALVIATGASTPSPLLSLNQDEKFLRESWKSFRQALPNAKSIVIAGGGPAGIETAGELGEYLNGRAGWFSSELLNPKVSITVVTSASQILPILRPSIAKKAKTYLGEVGVTVIKNSKVQAVVPKDAGTSRNLTASTTVSLDNGTTLEADLYIPATGTKPNINFLDPSLVTSDDRIETNPSTLRVDKAGPRIYAIGDAASYARPAVHLVLDAVPVLCANVKRDLLLAAGTEKDAAREDRVFKEDTRETHMVPIGKSKGVGAAMGYQLPSFLVWLIKGRDYWLWTTGNLWSGKQWNKEA
jgi:NADH dehydrogenase FAD-containing subunit